MKINIEKHLEMSFIITTFDLLTKTQTNEIISMDKR